MDEAALRAKAERAAAAAFDAGQYGFFGRPSGGEGDDALLLGALEGEAAPGSEHGSGSAAGGSRAASAPPGGVPAHGASMGGGEDADALPQWDTSVLASLPEELESRLALGGGSGGAPGGAALQAQQHAGAAPQPSLASLWGSDQVR